MPLLSKQYVVTLAAGQERVGISPQNPDRRQYTVQNTGANPALLRFENAVQFDGGDFEIASKASLSFHNPDTCPRERVNVYSALGTTLAILEGNNAKDNKS